MPLPCGEAPRLPSGARLTGRWRYDRTAGRGIALSYERRPHVGWPFRGRWRYDRVAGRGIRLCYDRSASVPPAARAAPVPISPDVGSAPMVRVLCTCGEDFTFEGDAAMCPRCGRVAEWPTMGKVEREMRSDLAELLRAHEPGSEPSGS